jgi:RNA polymerase sigma factor (sigma-70 family)
MENMSQPDAIKVAAGAAGAALDDSAPADQEEDEAAANPIRPSFARLARLLAVLEREHESRSPAFQAASAELVACFTRLVIRVIRRYLPRWVRPLVDAEDVAQELWITFFADRCFVRYSTRPRALVGFLCRLATSKVRDARRHLSRQRRDARRDESLPDGSAIQERGLLDRHPEPPAWALAGDLCSALLAGQDDTLSSVVQMRRHGFSLLEIADQLTISLSSVKRCLERARLRLQAAML